MDESVVDCVSDFLSNGRCFFKRAQAEPSHYVSMVLSYADILVNILSASALQLPPKLSDRQGSSLCGKSQSPVAMDTLTKTSRRDCVVDPPLCRFRRYTLSHYSILIACNHVPQSIRYRCDSMESRRTFASGTNRGGTEIAFRKTLLLFLSGQRSFWICWSTLM
jgi:hypothetical protein